MPSLFLLLAPHTLDRFLTRQSEALVLGRRRVRDALAAFLAVHGDGAAGVALKLEAGADVVIVASAVGPVVAEVVAAVAHNESGSGARKEKKNG
jgi:hypothetical protein